MPRYDSHTEREVQEVYFRDFDTGFTRNPVTGNLATVQNEEDVRRLIRNLVLTVRGERPYQPDVGSRIMDMLFENSDPVTIDLVETTVRQTIANHLPNVRLYEVRIRDNGLSRDAERSGYDPNTLTLTVVFSMINSTRVAEASVPLRRVR